MEIKPDFPLHTIKKIKRIADYYGMVPDVETQVNQLLSKGWVLIALVTKEIIPGKEQRVVFTLGHTDPSADDTVEVNYTRPEDL